MAVPDVTVYVPTYRRAALLRECLQSLIDQGLESDEYVVAISDNASPDDTPQVIKEFESRLQIDYLRRPSTVSMAENINGVADMTKTPYVTIMCDDDLMTPGQLGRAMRCLRKHPDACLFSALGLAHTAPGDPSAWLLGLFLDLEPVAEEPFVYAWTETQWLAICSLQTPATLAGSVFKLDSVPMRPVFDPAFPQEGDRLLFASLAGQGEIYSSSWLGCHYRFHSDQETNRNASSHDVATESEKVTALLLEKAKERGVDLMAYWSDYLPGLDHKRLEAIGSRMNRAYPNPLTQEILQRAGVFDRWRSLRKARRKAKKDTLPRQGFVGRLRSLLER